MSNGTAANTVGPSGSPCDFMVVNESDYYREINCRTGQVLNSQLMGDASVIIQDALNDAGALEGGDGGMVYLPSMFYYLETPISLPYAVSMYGAAPTTGGATTLQLQPSTTVQNFISLNNSNYMSGFTLYAVSNVKNIAILYYDYAPSALDNIYVSGGNVTNFGSGPTTFTHMEFSSGSWLVISGSTDYAYVSNIVCDGSQCVNLLYNTGENYIVGVYPRFDSGTSAVLDQSTGGGGYPNFIETGISGAASCSFSGSTLTNSAGNNIVAYVVFTGASTVSISGTSLGSAAAGMVSYGLHAGETLTVGTIGNVGSVTCQYA
jgi:hypothetical protein